MWFWRRKVCGFDPRPEHFLFFHGPGRGPGPGLGTENKIDGGVMAIRGVGAHGDDTSKPADGRASSYS